MGEPDYNGKTLVPRLMDKHVRDNKYGKYDACDSICSHEGNIYFSKIIGFY